MNYPGTPKPLSLAGFKNLSLKRKTCRWTSPSAARPSLIKTPVISWKQHKSIDGGMDKEDVVHIYNGVLFIQKKRLK